MSREIEGLFPGLSTVGYPITSQATPEYNCIAWAAGDTERWWWPDAFGEYYWPSGVPREESQESFERAYRTLGYERCGSADLEPGCEKIAIYIDTTGTPTHAARQQASGVWTSKLGQMEDIEHADVECLEESLYGRVALILRRTTPAVDAGVERNA